jgi:hypothetical protein
MHSRTKLSALLCCALLTSVSGVAAQAAPETPSESTEAPAEAPVEAPAAAPTTEAREVPAEATPPAPAAQTSEESAPATETAPEATEPSPAAEETQLSTGIVLQPSQTGTKVDTDEPAKQATCGSGTIALSSGGCGKSWRVIGYGEYSQLVVTKDANPELGRAMRFFAQGSYRLAKKYNVSLWGRIRYLQNFVAEEGESAARFQDPIIGLDYMHQKSFKEQGYDWANLSFQHRVTGSIPAQRETRKNDLYTRISMLERMRLSPIPSVYVGPDLVGAYNFYQYAEGPGQQSTTLPQTEFSGTLVAEYYPWESEKYGSILIGVDGGLGYTLLYKGRGGETIQEAQRWRQNYNWDVYAYYMPIPQVWIGAAISHGQGVMREGVIDPDFWNRRTTQMSLSVTALY